MRGDGEWYPGSSQSRLAPPHQPEQCRVESGEENALEPPDLTADQRHRRRRRI
jgi:hypothetical protein